MRSVWVLALVAALLYLASGFYVVKGDEQAFVRRFGRAQPALVTSGLHFELPWPFARIDRVNRNAARTLSIGIKPLERIDPQPSQPGTALLRPLDGERQGEFLTGDKNILHLQADVQYTISDPVAWFCRVQSPEVALRLLAESLITDGVARSGVDFVHPLGLEQLREFLVTELRRAVERQSWGLSVEDVTLVGVYPPVEVKASFLDVSNARAEKDRTIQLEQTRAEQRISQSRAAARQMLDRAESERNTRVEAARGAADRFLKIIAQFRQEASTSGATYGDVRHRTLRRLYAATLEELLPKLAGKVIVDGAGPTDLTILPQPELGTTGTRSSPASK